eukprot:4399169-Amphidinium_carterae.1
MLRVLDYYMLRSANHHYGEVDIKDFKVRNNFQCGLRTSNSGTKWTLFCALSVEERWLCWKLGEKCVKSILNFNSSNDVHDNKGPLCSVTCGTCMHTRSPDIP